MNSHMWTDEQKAWLRVQYRKMDRNRLLDKFNETFGCNVTSGQLRGAFGNYAIRQYSRTGRFVSEGIPYNKGTKGLTSANKTSFRKGRRPHNARHLWHERVNASGIIEMQVPERNPYTGYPSRYVSKHVWIWEQANGKRPKGCAIIFRDGNNRNFEPDNLILVTRKELLVLNQRGYAAAPEELKPTILALAKMESKAGIKPRRVV